MRRIEPRWQTRFGGWVGRFTVARLTAELGARGLGVDRKTVHSWLAGVTMPRPSRAMALVEMSNGAISVADIFTQRQQVGRGRS